MSGLRRRGSSDSRSYPSYPSPAGSAYSATSTSNTSAKSRWSFSSSSSSDRNPVLVATRSFVGAFSGCFTPPKDEHGPEEHGPPSVDGLKRTRHAGPGASRSSNERGRGSRRSIYATSPLEREPGTMRFTIEEIYTATRNFSPAFKIGQGGFGTVYKGRLNDGTLIAVKRAKKGVYEKHLGVEFQSEIRTLAQVEHLNLVKFFGFLEHGEEKIVVVEYVSNGTLREHLDCMHGTVLDISARLDIAIDVAHAITYLHMYTHHPIIHRDIKSSNILLTENFRAKVSDFGFARFAPDGDSGKTHVSTQVKGTAGYLDPEYLRTYQLTDKSDVFSFGVLLTELVTGRRPIEPKREMKERLTAKWAAKKFMEGDAIATLDTKLERTAPNNFVVEKILELALQCLAPNRRSRPSMRHCAEILWGIRKDYREISGNDFHSLSSHSP
ncbi:hypothetical protein MLD38_018274 [Melastoma candidum]|uniref:Uncharacterized protein n=1 Tax=Melastoma candidum TaxID=119954 RepID=A0ACB9R1K2_9MYRT|nr:hypothetical protein MLD38_018274 [Melastoma candidum]